MNLIFAVKPSSKFDSPRFVFDLHNRDHVKALALLISFRFKLPGIREILLNLIDDHVKHVFEHVKLRRDRVVLSRGHNRTERGSAGSISFLGSFLGKLTSATALDSVEFRAC